MRVCSGIPFGLSGVVSLRSVVASRSYASRPVSSLSAIVCEVISDE